MELLEAWVPAILLLGKHIEELADIFPNDDPLPELCKRFAQLSPNEQLELLNEIIPAAEEALLKLDRQLWNRRRGLFPVAT